MEQLQSLNKILFYGNKGLLRGQTTEIRSIINRIIRDHQLYIGVLEFNIIDDDGLLEINQSQLKHDYYTDIITFDYCFDKYVEGDIYISEDRVKDNAKTFGYTPKEELARVVFHGVLHLCGYKDKKKADQKIMRDREEYYLKLLKRSTGNTKKKIR